MLLGFENSIFSLFVFVNAFLNYIYYLIPRYIVHGFHLDSMKYIMDQHIWINKTLNPADQAEGWSSLTYAVHVNIV